jgi:hypothetical protein
MALVVKDRVRVSSITAGTGTITLGAAITGFQDFSVIGNGNTTYYTIVDPTTGDWEVGIGTYSSTGPTLARNTILESSNSGAAVNFLSNPKDVFVTYPAERSVYVDGAAISPATASRLGFTNLAQGSALSVLGVTGNATANLASIAAATDHQVMRRSGTAVAFGAVALNQSAAVTGTLPIANGGTGLTTTPANGALDIGNGTGFTRTTLTAGTGVTITNGAGSISIAAVNNGTVTSVASGNGMNFTTITGSGTVTLGTPSTLTTSTTNATTTTSHTHAITTASANTVSTIVARDASGNFSAGTITAALSGNATTATTATNVTVTTSATASAFKVPFANTTVSTTGNYGLLQDSAAEFTYNPSTNTLTVGTVAGGLSGNATTATTLATARTINGVSFNGSANITITSNTTNTLTRGTYLTGNNFNGSAATTWAVDATTTNTASKVVARDASGNFAAGTITASLSGNATSATNATNVAVTTSATASAFKVPFANTTASTTGNYGLLQDSLAEFTYNPSTNTLTVGTVSGALSGNATTATNATNVTVTTSSTASAFKIPFANTTVSTTGNYGLLQDNAAEFTYNPSTNTLTVGTVSGAVSGNATTATTLQTARTINGTSFNGSANITTANWGTARTLWGQSVNGSANITAPLRPAAGTAALPAFSTSGDTNTGIFFPAADTLAFAEGGTEVIRINSSSNVGVGTTSPGEKLDVNGSVRGLQLIASNGIVVNSATVSANYTIPTGSNAMSAGAVTIADGITVTVSDGSNWVVI